MLLETLLPRLGNVRRTGLDSWQALCPAHDDRNPSLSIRQTDDGKILLHCFAGCEAHEVVEAIGLDLSALFPPRQHHGKPARHPFPAADALRAVAFEALVVIASATALLAGDPLGPEDRERLVFAVARIQSALFAVLPQSRGVRHV